jgi:hypothetical protein
MVYAAIDIHKHAFQAAVLDPDSGKAARTYVFRVGMRNPAHQRTTRRTRWAPSAKTRGAQRCSGKPKCGLAAS